MHISVVLETKAIVPSESSVSWDLPYYNLVVLGKTSFSPHDLLAMLKQVERKLGRDPHASRWSPRVIDLDILAWDQEVISSTDLVIPHPELIQRPFFIQLMASLWPEWCYPVPGFTYSGLSLNEILHSYIRKERHFLKSLSPFPHLVGIVNVTPDSFSDGGSNLCSQKSVEKIQEIIFQGAAVIDIGAQSTRPGAHPISSLEEWQRLEPVFEYLSSHLASQKVKPFISLDSHNPQVIRRALAYYPIDWINDVQGNEDVDFLKLVSETHCKVVLNHSLGIPPSQQQLLPFDKNPIECICEWAEKKILLFKSYGVDKERIIIDPGIGFGKSMLQSFSLLREISRLKSLGCEILVGHSRKSFLDCVTTHPYSERDIETMGISHYLYRQGVDYLRVHNIDYHHRALAPLVALEGYHGHLLHCCV